MATDHLDGDIRLWDVPSLQPKAKFTHGDDSLSVQGFSPDGRILAASASGLQSVLWDIATGQVTMLVDHGGDSSGTVAFSLDGRFLATTWGIGSVKLWNFPLRREHVLIPSHTDYLSNIEVNASGDLLATSCQDGTAKLWSVKDGQLYAAFTDVGAAYFGPDGKTLAYPTGDRDRLKITLWDVEKRQQFASLTGHTGIIWDYVFSPGKNVLASLGQDQTIRVWNIAR